MRLPVQERADERPARIMLDAVYTSGGRAGYGRLLVRDDPERGAHVRLVECSASTLCSCENGGR